MVLKTSCTHLVRDLADAGLWRAMIQTKFNSGSKSH